ncbi:MAG: nucleotidyltransferase domain-containing protein [Ardenticatenia bacterium]|nr:nucleotidyltransferase domain-containing protein [Ardenticatenia bacterium]
MNEKSLNTYLQRLAREYTETLKETLGDRLVSVVLFGSVARGEAGPTSDIDLFVVLEEAPRGMRRRRALLEPARQRLTPALEALWQQGIYTDFVEIIRSREEARRFHPVYLDMTEEAVILYDKNAFFAGILERLRRRLQELGARKKRIGKVWYWDLKPDFRPGEVIEL